MIEHWYMPLRVSANDPRLRSGRLLPSSLAPLAPNTGTPTGDRTHSRLRRSSTPAGAARLQQALRACGKDRKILAFFFFNFFGKMAEVGKWQILGGDLPLKIFKKKMLLKVDFLEN